MTESLYPSYCELFKGSVELARRAVIKAYEETGNIPEVASIKVLCSVPLLDQAAIEADKQWLYEPLIIDGQPRGVVFTVTVAFRLHDNQPGKKKPD